SKTASHLPDTLSQAQIQEVLDRLKSRCEETEGTNASPLALRDFAMVAVLYSTGIRVAELEGLDIDDINLPRSLIKVTGNGDKHRMVRLTAPAVKALDAGLTGGRKRLLAEKYHTPPIFLGARGNRIRARQNRDVVNRLFRELGS